MKKFMTICYLLMGIGSIAAKAEQQLNQTLPGYSTPDNRNFMKKDVNQPTKSIADPSKTYVPKSGGLPSLDFVKRFGKHCTSHKNMIGRQVSGLCDDANVCDPKQYKACYKHCIQERKKEDEKTMYIFSKLASCSVNPSDKESVEIFNQANLRLNQEKRKYVSSKSFETPVDKYQPQRSEGIRTVTKTLNPFSTNCTTHKNALGMTTSGVCDNGKQCQTANYKTCYNKCVTGRPADEKTPYILKKLNDCRISYNDLETGKMAQDVYNRYYQYELRQGRTLLDQHNSKGLSKNQSMK